MEVYKDLGHLFIHKSTLRFYVKCGCIKKGTYPFLSPRKREPTRIPMASSAWVFRSKNACPRALPKGRPRMEMPPCKAQEKSVDLGRSVRTPCPGGGFLPSTPLRWTPVLQILEREFRNDGAEPLFRPSRSKTSHRWVGLLLGLLGVICFGLHGSGVPSRGFSSLNICGWASWFWSSLSCLFVKSLRGSFKSVKPNRLSSLDWEPPGDFVVGLRGFSSNP